MLARRFPFARTECNRYFVQQPKDPVGHLTHLMYDFSGLEHEFRTLAELHLTSKLVFFFKGGEMFSDVLDHWAIPQAGDYCEILGSGVGLGPLNARSIREILETLGDYREILPYEKLLCTCIVRRFRRCVESGRSKC